MRFKDLKIGQKFRFESEWEFPYSGIKTGPWEKTSTRTYVHLDDGMKCQIGSINCEVRGENDENP